MKINGIEIHESITLERIAQLIEDSETSLDNPGLCIICGEDAGGCEPDAENYECESCGAEQVFGAQELLLRLA